MGAGMILSLHPWQRGERWCVKKGIKESGRSANPCSQIKVYFGCWYEIVIDPSAAFLIKFGILATLILQIIILIKVNHHSIIPSPSSHFSIFYHHQSIIIPLPQSKPFPWLQQFNLILILPKMSEASIRSDLDLQKKYSQLLGNYKKAIWGCAASLFGLTGTYLYSKYQIFRKQKVIDQKDNEIQSQKQELVHLKNQAKQINKELAEEVKVILKNLKNNVMNDPNMQSFSNSLKTEINSTFEQINGAVRNKVEELKHFNYKESMEEWYMANLMGTSGLKLDRVRRIEIVEAHWQHPNPEVLKDGYALFEGGYAWRKDSTPSNIDNRYKNEFKKMKEYFQKKNSYETRGVEIHANTENLGDTFGKYKILQIRYRCWGFDIKSGAFTTPLYTKLTNSEQLETEKTKIIGEGHESYVECSDNEWFKKE